jgi:hypothetical protein
MFTRVQQRAGAVFTLVLIGVAVTTLLVCQLHDTSVGHEHPTPFTHQHGSSGHASRDSFCLIAVLPAVMGLTVVRAVWLSTAPYHWQSALLVWRPFIPPRTTIH